MALLDQWGRPIRTARLREEIAGPSVAAVRPIVSTRQTTGIDPRRLAAILREAEDGYATAYVELAEEMEEKNLHYLAVLTTRRRQVSQLAVTVEPADDSAEAEADAALARLWVDRHELEEELFDLLDAIGKGWAVCEIVWETSERQWMPARLEYRLPRWFIWDRETGSRLLLRDPAGPNGWVELEPGKFVVHRHAAKSGAPVRGGLARAAAWAWVFKSYTLRDWVRFCEGYGQPIRVGTYDRASSAEERDVLLDAVTRIAVDSAAIVPAGMEITFPEPDDVSANAGIYRDLIAYLDAEVSKAVLGQTLTTEPGSSGSYSLGQVHNEVRRDIERADARQLAATLQRDIVRPLVLLNRGDPGRRGYPRIVIGREERGDPAMLAEAVARLAPLGLRVGQAELRAALGLTEPEAGAEILQPPAAGPGAGPGPGATAADTAADAAARAAARSDPEPTDAFDRAVGDLIDGDGWEPLIEPVLGPVLDAAAAALERGDSLTEFRDALPDLFAAMDADPLARSLRRMGFTAALSGAAGLAGDDPAG